MVGVIAELNSRSGKLGDLLGSALGKGLSNFTNNYYANKDLEKVLNDKSLEGAPSAKKLSALERALAPHGEVGKNLFQNRLLIEQQEQQEKKLKQQEREAERAAAFKEREVRAKEDQVEVARSKLEQKEQQQQKLDQLLGLSPFNQPSGQSVQPAGLQSQNISQQPQNSSRSLTDEQILAIGSVNPQLASLLEKQKEFQQRQDLQKQEINARKQENLIKRESQVSNPILLKNSEQSANLPIKRAALNQMEEAIQSGDASGIIPYLVESTGFEPFRNANSSKLKTAGKEFFLSNISRAGARPNQWIEQQISSAFPQIGRSKEGNQTALELLRYQQDVEEKRIQTINQLSEKYRNELGDGLTNRKGLEVRPAATVH